MTAEIRTSNESSPSRPWRLALNVLLFQLGWFACVLGAARGVPWAGSLCALAVMVVHLASVRRAAIEARLLLAAMALGVAFDTLLVQTGALRYTSGHLHGVWGEQFAPHWIVALWGLLATTLNVSLRWLKGRFMLAAVLGAVAAPLSYWAGVRLGAAHWVDAPLALGVLALGWAALMPVLLRLSDRYDGTRSR